MKILNWSLVFMMAQLHSSELPKVTGEQREYHHTRLSDGFTVLPTYNSI